MKKRNIYIILFFLFAVLSSGCNKNSLDYDQQTILFQTDYINYAWGYQHYGYLIDNKGNIYLYNNPEEWNFLDENLLISENKMLENLTLCTLSDQKIAKDELQKYSGYINNISLSKVSAIKNVGADAGSKQYICFEYSEQVGKYKGSLIKMEGDFTCENLNFYSKRVSNWLKEIDSSLQKN